MGLGLPWREGASLTEDLDEVELDVVECDQRWDRQRASKYLKAGGEISQKVMVAIRNLLPVTKFCLGRGAKPVQGGEEDRWLKDTLPTQALSKHRTSTLRNSLLHDMFIHTIVIFFVCVMSL